MLTLLINKIEYEMMFDTDEDNDVHTTPSYVSNGTHPDPSERFES